jgi:hypothetical protein
VSILELKQAVSRLSKREREEFHAYLISLRHNNPKRKRTTSHSIRSMQADKGLSSEELRLRSLERRGLIRRPKAKGSVLDVLKKMSFPKSSHGGASLTKAILNERAEDSR